LIAQPNRHLINPAILQYREAVACRTVSPWRAHPDASAALVARYKNRAERERAKMLTALLGLGYPLERVTLDPGFIERVHPGRDRFAGLFDAEAYFRPKGATCPASFRDTVVVIEPLDNRPDAEGYGHWMDGQVLDEWAVKLLASVWNLTNPGNPVYVAFSADLL
jgi:hypothetical protein